MNLEIKYADEKDLIFIDHLQKLNAEELSFYPKIVFEREIKNQRILLALVNNQHAGYLYHGSLILNKPLKIHQACIEYDLRGNWYGAGLVNFLEDLALISGCSAISLRCGSDIAANRFWKLMDFHCIDIQEGGVRRMRDINVWLKQLQKDLFGVRPQDILEPSKKKKNSSIWRKRNKDLKQSNMLRGKYLIEYRKKIINDQENNDE